MGQIRRVLLRVMSWNRTLNVELWMKGIRWAMRPIGGGGVRMTSGNRRVSSGFIIPSRLTLLE